MAVRLRRDFGAVLNLIRSHALLHRATREMTGGRIVATVEDYAVVRELISDLISEGAEATVPEIVRETVEAVERLIEDSDEDDAVNIRPGGGRARARVPAHVPPREDGQGCRIPPQPRGPQGQARSPGRRRPDARGRGDTARAQKAVRGAVLEAVERI